MILPHTTRRAFDTCWDLFVTLQTYICLMSDDQIGAFGRCGIRQRDANYAHHRPPLQSLNLRNLLASRLMNICGQTQRRFTASSCLTGDFTLNRTSRDAAFSSLRRTSRSCRSALQVRESVSDAMPSHSLRCFCFLCSPFRRPFPISVDSQLKFSFYGDSTKLWLILKRLFGDSLIIAARTTLSDIASLFVLSNMLCGRN